MNIQPVLIRIPFQPDLTNPQRVERQRIFARIALDHCARLSGIPAGLWPQTAERVPMPRDGFHWSIAHKPRFAAAVIARGPVGIDIEALTPRTRDLSTAVASPEEWAIVKQKKRQQGNKESRQQGREGSRQEGRIHEECQRAGALVDWDAFFRVWTAKEATLKANSKGIGGLKACRLVRTEPTGRFILVYEERNFGVEHFSYAAHIAACTCQDSRLVWHVIEGPSAHEFSNLGL